MLDSNPIPSPEVSTVTEVLEQKSDVLVAGLTEEGSLSSTLEAVNELTGGWVQRLIEDGEIRGKRGELTLLASPTDTGPRMLLIVGLGSGELDRHLAFESGAMVVRRLGDRERELVILSISEFLTLPVSDGELSGALQRVSHQKFGNLEGGARSSEVIAIAGATGGVGTTSTAVNLGCVLAENTMNSVALLDLDLALGDADVFLDSIPDYTLADVVQNVARLDIQLLKRSLTKHSSGLYLLPRPVELHDTNAITHDNIRKVVGLLKASFTHLIIDLSKTYSPIDMAAIESASKVVLVTQLDLPCLRNVVRLMMSFEEMEDLKDKVEIVVNRAGLESGQISLKKAKETLGREVFALLPNDYRTMVEVRN
ncbi:AAA family ATPase, partial [bacterium]|nr:AAA family ATPase [bacterium]